MGRELKSFTTVGGVTYPPGPVDAEIAEKITNPKAWGESVEDEAPKPAKKAAAKRSSSK